MRKCPPLLIVIVAAALAMCAWIFCGGDVFAGTLTCSFTTSTCNSPAIVMLRLASSTNSHAELPTDSDYPVMVCCTGVTGLGNSCAATVHAVLLNLHDPTNSHVEENSVGLYTNSACISVTAGTVSVGYETTTTCALAGFDTTVMSIVSTTNSHSGGPNDYPVKVCASAASSSNAAPTVSGVTLNHAASIVLTAGTTTPVSVNATIADTNGCSDVTGGTTTILLYRSGISSSTCKTSPNNLNCYTASAFTASSTCSSNSVNTTTTFNVQYFAQATDASSSFSSQSWIATVIFKDSGNATGSGDSTGQELLTLTAINVTTSSVSYGTVSPGLTTGSTNQTTTVQNAGNSSTTLQISGTALTKGANLIATSSEHYATTSFTYGGAEQQLNGSPTTVPGFLLTAPTSTSIVQSNLYWGLGISPGEPTGTYAGTVTLTPVFSG
jgi:hypothetical protein